MASSHQGFTFVWSPRSSLEPFMWYDYLFNLILQAGMWYIVFIICLAAATAEVAQKNATSRQERQEREERVLSVFNVVTFPNSACGASNGYNGTCYTSSGRNNQLEKLEAARSAYLWLPLVTLLGLTGRYWALLVMMVPSGFM